MILVGDCRSVSFSIGRVDGASDEEEEEEEFKRAFAPPINKNETVSEFPTAVNHTRVILAGANSGCKTCVGIR
jgi:hypothetical protein